jgi:outer membrane protein
LRSCAGRPWSGALSCGSLRVPTRQRRPARALREERFFPELSLEGGPLRSRLEQKKTSGTALFGKADWNLFRGGADWAAVEKAGIRREHSELRLRSGRARALAEVEVAYYEMLFLLESIALKESALAMNEEQKRIARRKKASGLTSETDVIEFDLREATLRSDLRLLSQERDEKARELAVLAGRDTPIYVKGHLEKASLSLSKEVALGRLQETETLEAVTELRLAEKDRQIARSRFLPSVNLEARYGRLADKDKVYSGGDNYTLFLSFSLPLFSGLSTYHDAKSAGFVISAREAAFDRESRKSRALVDDLFSRMEAVSERLVLEEKNLSRSENYYKLTLDEYRRGVKNSPDMVGASERLLGARIRNLEHRKELLVTKSRIQALSGIEAR